MLMRLEDWGSREVSDFLAAHPEAKPMRVQMSMARLAGTVDCRDDESPREYLERLLLEYWGRL